MHKLEGGHYGVQATAHEKDLVRYWIESAIPYPGKVFADTRDTDYQKVLALCREGKRHLDQIKRFDMPGFRPPAMYVREMQRYGILAPGPIAVDMIDVYQTDQEYWRSLSWR